MDGWMDIKNQSRVKSGFYIWREHKSYMAGGLLGLTLKSRPQVYFFFTQRQQHFLYTNIYTHARVVAVYSVAYYR